MIIRWICEKDNKKWIYPIEKCIYCKGPIKKQISREAKVIGITKVNIPSPLHPITPYNVILLEDSNGNRIPKKTMKEYNIGDSYSIEKAKTKNALVINKIKYDLGEALKESIELLDSFDIKEGDKVLIKPSIIEPAYAYQAVNTNPKLIEEVIKFLKGNGIKDILVAEQSMLGNDVGTSAKKSGIIDVCKKNNVIMQDLGKTDFVLKEVEGFEFNISKDVIDRKIISIPVMKTHSQIGVAGAMENMIRVLDANTQKRMYDEDIDKTLPKLMKALPEILTIGDATLGMHGQGPTVLGEPAFLNMLLISKDPVIIDMAFSEIGMLDKPDYIKEALALGLGCNKIMEAEIIGEDIEAIKFNLRPSKKNISPHPRIKLIDGKANPQIFNMVLKICTKLSGLAGYELNIAIGKYISKEMVIDKIRIVALGKDAIDKLKELDIKPMLEINENMDNVEKLVLIKGILEDPDKESVNLKDKLISKISKIGNQIKNKF